VVVVRQRLLGDISANMIRAHPIRLGVRVMDQSDSDYLKGFTLLQSRDALGEAWSSLKKEDDDSRELENMATINMAQSLGAHPASVKLALDRMQYPPEIRRKAGWLVNEDGVGSSEFLDHVREGQHSTDCHPCGWKGQGHELHRDHPLDEGRCPKCATLPETG